MKCNKCQGDFPILERGTVGFCPYCGTTVFSDIMVGKEPLLHEMLLRIVQQFGSDTLGQPRLKGLFADLMPNAEKRHLRILRQAVDDGIGARLLRMQSDTHAVRTLKITTLKENFRNNNAFNHTADYVVDCFLFAVGWLEHPPKEDVNTAQVNTLNILQHTVEMAFADGRLSKEEAKSIFSLAKTLNAPEDEVVGLIDEKLKAQNFKPEKPIDQTLRSKKEIILSQDWVLKNEVKIEEEGRKTGYALVSANPIEKGTVNVFQSKTGKFYGCWVDSNEFIGILSSDFDREKDAFIITVIDPDSGESWSFIGNHVHREKLESVKIGNQVWMKKNLDVSHFRNGDPIPEAKTNEEWEKAGVEKKPAWCYYDNDPENGKIYGKLYNWYAVNDSRGLAPIGWQIPSDDDWDGLIELLGGHTIAGGKLKEIGTSHWKSPNEAATNESGFSALPGGGRVCDYGLMIYPGDFNFLGVDGSFWSSTENNRDEAWEWGLIYNSSQVYRSNYNMGYGRSVRCVRYVTYVV